MCQATKTLGSGSQNQPNGDRDVSNPVGECPIKDLASIMVEVYEANSATILRESDVNVTLGGPSAGQVLAYSTATTYVTKLTPGTDYKVRVAPVSGGRLEGAEIKGDLSGDKSLALGKGETRRVVFRLFPPATRLVVKVVDKDTGAAIPDTRFKFVARNTEGKEYADYTDIGGSKSIVVTPGAYDRVSVELTDADQKARFQIAELGKATVAAGKTEVATVKVAVKELKLISVDPYFAPGAEELEIKYEIGNLKDDSVLLQVFDRENAKILERPLTDFEKSDGAGHIIKWGKQDTDKVNCPGHALHDRFINPLFGPYRVVLFHSNELRSPKQTEPKPDRARFHVHCRATLDRLPWDVLYKAVSGRPNTDDPGAGVEPARTMWFQYKLNELGYWAGPIDGNAASEDLKRAVRRFRMAHPALCGWAGGAFYKPTSTDPLAYEMKPDDAMSQWSTGCDQTLANALAAAAPDGVKRDIFSDPAVFSNQDVGSKLFIDSHRAFIGEKSEFSRGDSGTSMSTKFRVEREWFSQPHVPLIAKVEVQTKGGQWVGAEGVKVEWSWADESQPGEEQPLVNAGLIPNIPPPTAAEPSYAGVFIARTIRDLNNDPCFGNNAVAAAGGVLGADHAVNAQSAFNGCAGFDPLQPLSTGVATVTTNKHKSAGVSGASVVYLRTSTLGGDRYRLQARCAWTPGTVLKTGPLIVWRRLRVAAFVTWPERVGFNLAAQMTTVAAEFARCHVLLDHHGLDTRKFHGADLLTKTDYDTIIDRTALSTTRKAYYKGEPRSRDAILPGEADFHPAAETTDALINAMIRADYLGRVAAAGVAPTATQLLDFKIAMRLATDWAASTTPIVRRAGEHWQTQLGQALEVDSGAAGWGAWKWKAGLAPNSVALAGFVDATPLNLQTLQDLYVPVTVCDELNTYNSDTTGAAKPDFVLKLKKFLNEGQSTETPPYPYKQMDTKPPFGRRQGDPWPPVGNFTPYAEYGFFKTISDRKTPGLWLEFNDELYTMRYPQVLDNKGAWVFNAADRLAPCGTRKQLLGVAAYQVMMSSKMLIAERVDERARAKLITLNKATDGLIIFDFTTNKPATLSGQPYLIPGAAFGGLNGVTMVDQGLVANFDALTAHEAGHCLFLQHAKNAPSTLLEDHDGQDDNCMMSYPTPLQRAAFDRAKVTDMIPRSFAGAVVSPEPHYCIDVFKPHFCGKCNLKLRGWNIRALGMPARANDPPPPGPPVHAVSIRCIAGTTRDDAASAASLDRVRVSCYHSTKCGASLAALEAFPHESKHHAAAATDTAAFRIEVVDPNVAGAGVDPIYVTLEALMPSYSGGQPTEWSPFDGEERKRRALIGVECHRVPAVANAYRSRYLRLVTDEADVAALNTGPYAKQGLLVTDLADGLNSEADDVEILDQRIQVTYDPTPPVAGPPGHDFPNLSKNRLQIDFEVGPPKNERRRIRLHFHLVGFTQPLEAPVLKNVRKRTRKWVRRVFASAGMSPKILGHDFGPWPRKNVLTIQSLIDKTGVRTSVARASGTTNAAAPSKLTLTLKAGADSPTWSIPLTAGWAPTDLGRAIAGTLDQGFTAVSHSVPPETDQYGHPASCDVVFTRGGADVEVVSVDTDDSALARDKAAFIIPTVSSDSRTLSEDDTYHGGTPTQRQILRSAASADDRVDVFVVPKWGLAGRAYPDYADDITLPALQRHVPTATQDVLDTHLPAGALRRAVILAYEHTSCGVMNDTDMSPFTFAHELVHVLGDVGHINLVNTNDANASVDVMYGTWPKTNSVDAQKRILSAPLKVSLVNLLDNVLGGTHPPNIDNVDMRDFIHTRGGGHVTEPW